MTWVTREQRHQQVEDRGANCREMTTGLFATDSLSSLMSDYLHHLSRPRCPIQWILCGWGHPQSTTLPLNLNTESADLVLSFNISEVYKKEKPFFRHKSGKKSIDLGDREWIDYWRLRVESKREQSVREQQLDNWTTGETKNDQSFTIIESESLTGFWSAWGSAATAAGRSLVIALEQQRRFTFVPFF